MPEQHTHHGPSFVAGMDQPLIAVPVERNGTTEVRYFVDDAQADAAFDQGTAKSPIKLAGVWSDLDAEEMLDSLERIRHESKPTPPIDTL